MATDFMMPTMPTSTRDHFFQQPQNMPQLPPFQQHYHQYSSNAQANAYTTAQAQAAAAAAAASNFVTPYNPQISPLSTSNNSSPTSPKSQYHTRQVRPLYMPAVLRPTQHPSREMPRQRNKAESGMNGAATGAEDAVDDSEDADDVEDAGAGRSSGSFISLPALGAFGIGRLTRRSTNDSGKCVDGAWNLELFPEVTGLPSRQHWKPDSESTMCDEPTCKKYFSYFTRRHHCRRCGNIFCDFHSNFEIPLDEKANYNPRGAPSRACSYCFCEFKAWRTRTNSSDLSSAGSTLPAGSSTDSAGSSTDSTGSSASSNSSSSSAGTISTAATHRSQHSAKAATAPTSPVMALINRQGARGMPTVAKTPDVAQSVPGDWSWSTF